MNYIKFTNGLDYIRNIQRENDSLTKENKRLAEALNAETMNKNVLLKLLKEEPTKHGLIQMEVT